MKDDMMEKIKYNPDYIAIRRFDYSLIKLLDRFENGVPDHVLENALNLEHDEAEELYKEIVAKLQKVLNA